MKIDDQHATYCDEENNSYPKDSIFSFRPVKRTDTFRARARSIHICGSMHGYPVSTRSMHYVL